MDDKIIFFAICYILFGIYKIIIGLSILFLSNYKLDNIPIIKYFSDTITDKTLAGQFYNYILLLFGIYTILCGLALLNVFSQNINNIFENKQVIYIIYSIFGLTILLFYLLVLYTNLPINKDLTNNETQYTMFCYGGGLSFLIVPIFMNFMKYVKPVYKSISKDNQTIIIIGLIIMFSIIIDIIYNKIKKSPHILTNNPLIPIKPIINVKNAIYNTIPNTTTNTIPNTTSA